MLKLEIPCVKNMVEVTFICTLCYFLTSLHMLMISCPPTIFSVSCTAFNLHYLILVTLEVGRFSLVFITETHTPSQLKEKWFCKMTFESGENKQFHSSIIDIDISSMTLVTFGAINHISTQNIDNQLNVPFIFLTAVHA